MSPLAWVILNALAVSQLGGNPLDGIRRRSCVFECFVNVRKEHVFKKEWKLPQRLHVAIYSIKLLGAFGYSGLKALQDCSGGSRKEILKVIGIVVHTQDPISEYSSPFQA